MHTPTIFDQTDRTRTLTRYDSAGFDEYLSDSNSYNNNDSDCESDDYNIHRSNYESDSEEALCALTSTTITLSFQLPNIQEQKTNTTYTLRQKKFNNDFKYHLLV